MKKFKSLFFAFCFTFVFFVSYSDSRVVFVGKTCDLVDTFLINMVETSIREYTYLYGYDDIRFIAINYHEKKCKYVVSIKNEIDFVFFDMMCDVYYDDVDLIRKMYVATYKEKLVVLNLQSGFDLGVINDSVLCFETWIVNKCLRMEYGLCGELISMERVDDLIVR